MKNKTIAILESRSALQLADLVRKYEGIPLSAPALAETPDVDHDHISELIHNWDHDAPDIFIFQTGVGVKVLLHTTDDLNLTGKLQEILRGSLVVVRGPKPSAALRAYKVRIDLLAESPYTTNEIIELLDKLDLRDKTVVVQRYGNTNQELQERLESKGAKVTEIATYRWSMPDPQPLIHLMDALDKNEVDMVCFTSASQAENLFNLAKDMHRSGSLLANINQILVASIGPVCSNALRKLGIHVDVEPSPPKLGPLISAINLKFSSLENY